MKLRATCLESSSLTYALRKLGCQVTRQTGAHLRLTTPDPSGHHIAIPNHDPIRVGTLAVILRDLAGFHGMSRDDLLDRLFNWWKAILTVAGAMVGMIVLAKSAKGKLKLPVDVEKAVDDDLPISTKIVWKLDDPSDHDSIHGRPVVNPDF